MSLVITVNLKGQLNCPIRTTKKDSQKNTVALKSGKNITKTILHKDRTECKAVQNVNVSESAVNYWISDNCPNWEKPLRWKKMNSKQRISSYVSRFDEGFGVNFELV